MRKVPPAEAFAAAREHAALSRPELADKAGVARWTLWRIETGQQSPRPKTIRAVAQALNLSVPALLNFGADRAEAS